MLNALFTRVGKKAIEAARIPCSVEFKVLEIKAMPSGQLVALVQTSLKFIQGERVLSTEEMVAGDGATVSDIYTGIEITGG